MGLGISFLQCGHGVWHVPCCVAAEGDCQDSHWDMISHRVAVQDIWPACVSCSQFCPGNARAAGLQSASTVHWSRLQA